MQPTHRPIEDGEKGLTRRKFLATGMAIAATGLAGCTGSGSRTPEETVQAYYEALNDGDIEAVRELSHDDRPDPVSDQDIAEWGTRGMKINKIELLEESGDKAILETVISVETNYGARVVTNEYELRKQSGGWKVYRTERLDVQ